VIKVVSWLALGLCALIASGGYLQTALSSTFWCGRVEAFPGTTVLAVICIGQAALYLAAAASPGWATAYRLTQAAVVPFLLYGLFQVFQPHPRTVLFFAGIGAIPMLLALGLPGWRWMRPQLPALSAFFVVSVLCFLAAFGEIPLTLPNVIATRWLIALAGIAAIATSAGVIGSMRKHLSQADRRWPDIAGYLPLALLLFPILRAKLPDIAYDSYMYKTTLPYQIAEWRTGDTAIIDGFMVGTNLQEMLNGLLVMISRDFLPSFISTISFVLLLLIMPLAFPAERRPTGVGRAVVAFAALSAFVVSEAAIDQGTSYQEPLLLLFLVASLIRCPIWPAFLAAAIAVKINAAFIAPLVLLYHIFRYRSFFLSPRLLIGVLAGMIVLLPQLNRNVIYSGRIMGLNETLAAVTDPAGPEQIMAAGKTRYDEKVRGGVLNNAIQSACNMTALNVFCSTQYHGGDNLGFHIFPTSRAPLFGVLFAAAILAGAVAHRSRRLTGIASVAVFLLCYAGLLSFLSEGRYFLPLSFGFSVLLLINPEQAEDAVLAFGSSRRGVLLAVCFACWLVGSSLIPGVFANVSWICKREIKSGVQEVDLRQPENPMQTFLASYVAKYKLACPPPGLPPVIVSEHNQLNSPYLGTQRVFHIYTQDMIARFFAANPTRQTRAADAIIAVVSGSPGYNAWLLGSAVKDYQPCFHDNNVQVMCSSLLAPAGTQCATSLYEPR
jgi:hypothetical protein